MKKYNVGVMGATGAVGQQMIKVLAERNFPIGELRCLASERSEGKTLSTPFGDVVIQRTCETAFDGLESSHLLLSMRSTSCQRSKASTLLHIRQPAVPVLQAL